MNIILLYLHWCHKYLCISIITYHLLLLLLFWLHLLLSCTSCIHTYFAINLTYLLFLLLLLLFRFIRTNKFCNKLASWFCIRILNRKHLLHIQLWSYTFLMNFLRLCLYLSIIQLAIVFRFQHWILIRKCIEYICIKLWYFLHWCIHCDGEPIVNHETHYVLETTQEVCLK